MITAHAIQMAYDILEEDGFILVKDQRLWIFDTSSRRGVSINLQPTGKIILIIIEAPITAPVIPSTISGLTLMPLVSSSKNLRRPALEAGRGAFFFLLLTLPPYFYSLKYIPLAMPLGSLFFPRCGDTSREVRPFASVLTYHSQTLFRMRAALSSLQLNVPPSSNVMSSILLISL